MTQNSKEIRWKQRFQNFENAYLFLSAALKTQSPSALEVAGIVQAFEFTLELGWKTLKDLLEAGNVTVTFPRDVIKEAYKAELIQDGELWLDMLEKRNLMSHTYNEKNAAKALDLIRDKFLMQLATPIKH